MADLPKVGRWIKEKRLQARHTQEQASITIFDLRHLKSICFCLRCLFVFSPAPVFFKISFPANSVCGRSSPPPADSAGHFSPSEFPIIFLLRYTQPEPLRLPQTALQPLSLRSFSAVPAIQRISCLPLSPNRYSALLGELRLKARFNVYAARCHANSTVWSPNPPPLLPPEILYCPLNTVNSALYIQNFKNLTSSSPEIV